MNPHTDLSLSRREFLATGTVSLISATLLSQSGWTGASLVPGKATLPLSGGGFLASTREVRLASQRLLSQLAGRSPLPARQSIEKEPSEQGAEVGMIDPSSLEQGDPLFLDRGVRLSVWGVVPKAGAQAPDAIDVEVLFSPFHSHRFTAWRFRKAPVWTVQAPCALNVPVEQATGLNLEVAMRWGLSTDSEGNPRAEKERVGRVHFALDREPGASKLLPGVHFIPLSPEGEQDLLRLAQGAAFEELSSPLLVLESSYQTPSLTVPEEPALA